MKTILSIFDFSHLLNARTGVAGITGGAIGTFIGKIYGGDLVLWFALALILAIGFDWLGGIAASKKDGSYASAYGIIGVMRTTVMLLLPALGSVLDIIFGTPNVCFYVLWGGIMLHTMISMNANFKRVGWNIWIPSWAIDLVTSEIEAKIKRSEDRTVSKADNK